jgi:AraC-like DNA-binding protein
MVSGAGSFFVYDARHASRVAWTNHEAMYVIIRRAELRAALGGHEPDAAELQAQLSRSPLQHVIRDQFQLTARHMQKLDTAGQAMLLQQAKQSTLLALAGPDAPDRAAESALCQAALHYIQNRLADPNLSADQIARALGCSRATLYRAFAVTGAGIAETIRDLRLDGLRRALEYGETERPVAEVAVSFGLYDTANLSRQFRRRFGMAPSDVVHRRRR